MGLPDSTRTYLLPPYGRSLEISVAKESQRPKRDLQVDSQPVNRLAAQTWEHTPPHPPRTAPGPHSLPPFSFFFQAESQL